MNSARAVKLLGLIIGVVLLNIIVLSPGLLGVKIVGGSTIEAAAGITLLVVSLIVVMYGSYTLLYHRPTAPPVRNIETHEDYVDAIEYHRHVKVIAKDMELALNQLDRIVKRKDTLTTVLNQRFDPAELSYKKFASVIDEVLKLFYLNVRGILNKLNVFDTSEFSAFVSGNKSARFSSKLVQEKTALYNEYLSLISGYIGANEEILLKLDKLLLEMSLLSSADYRDIEQMPCMKEIDQLIKQTKYYK